MVQHCQSRHMHMRKATADAAGYTFPASGAWPSAELQLVPARNCFEARAQRRCGSLGFRGHVRLMQAPRTYLEPSPDNPGNYQSRRTFESQAARLDPLGPAGSRG
jgi:hypothetical protein